MIVRESYSHGLEQGNLPAILSIPTSDRRYPRIASLQFSDPNHKLFWALCAESLRNLLWRLELCRPILIHKVVIPVPQHLSSIYLELELELE